MHDESRPVILLHLGRLEIWQDLDSLSSIRRRLLAYSDRVSAVTIRYRSEQ